MLQYAVPGVFLALTLAFRRPGSAMVAAGAGLVASGRNGEALDSLADEVRTLGGTCETHVADLAPALISSVIGRQMMERKAGAIVHLASLSSVVGPDQHAAYCSSKFGLQGLTQAMAVELGPYNVRVNSVGPTVVLTPMGRMAWSDPRKASPMKARILLVDGGFTD